MRKMLETLLPKESCSVMKRDMDLIRAILQRVEEADKSLSFNDLSFEGKTANEVGYHVDILIHHDFIDGNVERTWGGDYVAMNVVGLTWDGADFLEATGNNEVWSRAKEAVRNTVGSTTLSVIKATCEAVASSLIKSAL